MGSRRRRLRTSAARSIRGARARPTFELAPSECGRIESTQSSLGPCRNRRSVIECVASSRISEGHHGQRGHSHERTNGRHPGERTKHDDARLTDTGPRRNKKRAKSPGRRASDARGTCSSGKGGSSRGAALEPRGMGGPARPPGPVGLLEEQAKSRVQELVPIRYGRMLASPFAFYRGAAYLMASDLASTPRSGLLSRRAGTPTFRISACSAHPSASCCSTSTTSTRRPRDRGNGTSSAWPPAWPSRVATTGSRQGARRGSWEAQPARIGPRCGTSPRCATWRSGTPRAVQKGSRRLKAMLDKKNRRMQSASSRRPGPRIAWGRSEADACRRWRATHHQ